MADATGGLRFAWPEAASASVTEQVLKKGRHATTQYRIETRREGDEILVFYRDFKFLEIEGADMNDPEVRAALKGVEQQVMGSMPPYRISLDGHWLGFGDLDSLFQRVEGVVAKDTAAAMRAALATPDMRALIDEKLREVWRIWAELWIGVDLEPGDRSERSTEVSVMGQPVSMQLALENLGGQDNHARLRATSTLEGRAAVKALGEMAQQFAEGDAPIGPKEWAAVVDQMQVHRRWMAETSLDTKTLLPTEARMELRVTVTGAGEVRERIETHAWTFDWAADAHPSPARETPR